MFDESLVNLLFFVKVDSTVLSANISDVYVRPSQIFC